MRALLALLVLISLPTLAAGLNDTGVTQCLNAAGTALEACSSANTGDAAPYPRQDARFGRDPAAGAGQLSKTGGGAAGFDFTPLDASGTAIPLDGNGVPSTPPACVHDNVTGLTWEVKTPANKDTSYNWANATAYADTVSGGAGLCGISGNGTWRVPTRHELLSIVHRGTNSPAIDTNFFPNTASNRYWTSDISPPYPADAWDVDFNNGGTYANFRTYDDRVLLVYGVSAPAAFTDNSDGTVTDSLPGLMWDKCTSGQSGAGCAGTAVYYTWKQALALATSANTDNYKGHSDWRLPNIKELESLVKINASYPTIDATFPHTPSNDNTGYLSSTIYTHDPTAAWHVHFDDGHLHAWDVTYPNFYVRLMRSEQPLASFDSLAPIPVPTLGPLGLALLSGLLGLGGAWARRRRG